MPATLLQIVEPPLLAVAARPYLRLDDDTEDLELDLMIAALADRAGQETGRSIAKCQWALTLDAFPAGEIRLPWPPLLSVESVSYIDAEGAAQTLAPAAYVLDAKSAPGWLLPAVNTEWPLTTDTANAVTVTFTAGYGAACPEAIRLWILAYLAAHYRNRESIVIGATVAALPYVDGLLDRYRLWGI